MNEVTPARGHSPSPLPPEARTDGNGKYVYCVIRAPASQSFPAVGIGGAGTVYTVHHGDLAAVVSDAPLKVFDPTRENVLAHEYVNEVVMRQFTVIPMSFGTLFRTEEDVVELLRSTYDPFVDVLNQIENKIEFGLKVLWDREAVVAALQESDAELIALRAEIERNTGGNTYQARMQLGRRLEAAIEEAGNRYTHDIHEALRPASVASRSNKPIGERMILNAAFLVDRQQEREFDDRVKQISRKYENILTFRYTGPWPPYNFVSIKLKLEKAD